MHQISIPAGETLLFAAQEAGIPINSICGGEGICGKCRLILREGKIDAPHTSLLSREEIQRSYLLACQTRVLSDLVVEVPLETRLQEAKILLEEIPPAKQLFPGVEELTGLEALEKAVSYPCSPLCEKIYLELPQPDLADSLSDLSRLYRELRRQKSAFPLQTGLSTLKRIPALLRKAGWQITVILGNRGGTLELIDLEAGNTAKRNFGVAVDVGTTSIVASLLDLGSCKVLGTKGNYNAQISFGEDVISRIIYAATDQGLTRLHKAVIEVINQNIAALCLENNSSLSEITCLVCAGNTTMAHLLYQIEPGYLRKEPYIPAVTNFPVIRAAEIGIKINPRGLLAFLPGVSSYVGGDMVAGVLACGMNQSPELSLLMDIGTNGEVVVGNRDWLICASCSAGPAFEGGEIKHGMRAARGAIEKISIDLKLDKIDLAVIGGGKPRGICGSALIDLLAELMQKGLVNRAGKFNRSLPTGRLRTTDEGVEFILVKAEESEIEQDIVITETDLENLIRAKAAMYVGCDFLLKKMDLKFNQLAHFYIGGGFGNYLNIENAVTIGLLPDIEREKFEFIGNSSLSGAKLALLSQQAFKTAQTVANQITNFELSVESGFMNEYTAALFLPHTDISAFPTISQKLGWK